MDYYQFITDTINLSLIGKNIQLNGIENILDGKGILAPNHSDIRDVPLIAAKIPRKIYWLGSRGLVHENKEIRTDYYWNFLHHKYESLDIKRKPGIYNGLAKILSNVVGYSINKTEVFIPITNPVNGYCKNSVKKIIKKLSEDNLVCWFPSGVIVPNGEISKFQNGLASVLYMYDMQSKHNEQFSENELKIKISKKDDVPVYPVALKNIAHLFNKENVAYMSVGKPIYLSDFSEQNMDKKKLITTFTKKLEENVRNMHETLGQITNYVKS